MPGNILSTDILFPERKEGESDGQMQSKILNYLFLLKEQLGYSLYNLALENFNSKAFSDISALITKPVYAKITDNADNISALAITATELTSQLSTAEGNISTLQQTATTLTSQMSTAQGNISTLQQTATSLTSRITTAEGNISTISQTVNSITLGVSNGTQTSTITLYRNGIVVTSQLIQFSGMVTFTALATQGMTTINGGNITTGTISAITINSCTFNTLLTSYGGIDGELNFYYISYGLKVGGLRIDDQGAGTPEENTYRMFLYTWQGFALKLSSSAGLSLQAAGIVYLAGGTGVSIKASDAAGTYTFTSGGIYYNGSLVVST